MISHRNLPAAAAEGLSLLLDELFSRLQWTKKAGPAAASALRDLLNGVGLGGAMDFFMQPPPAGMGLVSVDEMCQLTREQLQGPSIGMTDGQYSALNRGLQGWPRQATMPR